MYKVVPMKILFLNYEYPPLGGGAGVATEAILNEWKDAPDFEVHLVTSAVSGKYEKAQLGTSVFVHRLPIGKNSSKLHSQSSRELIAYYFAALFFLPGFILREQKKGKFDATLAFFTVPCAALAFIVSVFFRIPYVVSLRGADVPGFSEKYDKLYFFLKPVIVFLWKKARVVIPNSKGIQSLALQTNPKQAMQIIENGIDTDFFKPGEAPKPASPFVFISTSRLTKRKRIDTLIRAFARASKKTSVSLELCVISDGEEKEALQALAKELGVGETVKFLGRVDRKEYPEIYARAHVFVLPSKNEGMSNSALEALSFGLPLIVSRTGGMEEIVTHEKNGLYVDPTDTEEFSQALLRLVKESELREEMSKESRKRALERSWGKTALQFKNVLEGVSHKKI